MEIKYQNTWTKIITTNINKTNRIALDYRNQIHYNYKLDEQAITNMIKRHIKPIKKQKQIKLFIYYTKFKTSNLIVKNNTNSAKIHLNQTNVVYKFICPFRECVVSPPLLRSVNGAVNNLNKNVGPYFHLGQGMLSQNPSPLTLLSFLLSPFLSRSHSPSAQSAEIVELLKRFQILNTRVDRRTFPSQYVALYTKNKIPLLKLIFVLLIYYLKYHNSSTYITSASRKTK